MTPYLVGPTAPAARAALAAGMPPPRLPHAVIREEGRRRVRRVIVAADGSLPLAASGAAAAAPRSLAQRVAHMAATQGERLTAAKVRHLSHMMRELWRTGCAKNYICPPSSAPHPPHHCLAPTNSPPFTGSAWWPNCPLARRAPQPCSFLALPGYLMPLPPQIAAVPHSTLRSHSWAKQGELLAEYCGELVRPTVADAREKRVRLPLSTPAQALPGPVACGRSDRLNRATSLH